MKMGKVIAKRFIFMIPVVLAVTFIIFILSLYRQVMRPEYWRRKKYDIRHRNR